MSAHRIYILPTRSWTVLLAVLAAMWYAAISQGNSAAYLLMFFLGSLVMISAIHAHFALAGLELRVGHIPAVFAGEPTRAPVEVLNPTRRPRMALAIAPRGYVFKDAAHVSLKNMEPGATETADLLLHTERRGRLKLERLALTTIYPLGFFRSWRYEPTDASCLVYPVPGRPHALADGCEPDGRRAGGRGRRRGRLFRRAPVSEPARASGMWTGGRWRGASRCSSNNFPVRGAVGSGSITPMSP